jgi:hypothetical protein
LSGRDLQRWVSTKFLVIIEVFVSQRNRDDALGEQGSLLMNCEDGMSRVRYDCVEGIEEPEPLGDLTEQERTRIGSETATQKVGDNRFVTEAGKPE